MLINLSKKVNLAVLLIAAIFSSNSVNAQNLTATDFSFPLDINEDLFSFNAGFMMEVCGGSNDSLYEGLEPPLNDYHLRESCVEITNQINPSVIRFPGGSGSNYYHYYGNGYGFLPSEVNGTKFENYLSQEQWAPENYIINFADLALQTGSKTIYVLNLFTHYETNGLALTDPTNEQYQYKLKENLDAIDYLLERGVEIVGVEMGNELYDYVEVNSTNGTRNKYLNLARVYSDSIKAKYPGMKIGVPIRPVGGYVDLLFDNWNKAMKFADFSDAYIIHEYERKVKNTCSTSLDKETYYDCAKQKLDEFLDLQLESVLNNYWTFYGKETKFWLTEWNMLEPQLVANSFLHSYFLVKYWNNLIQLDKKYPGNIEISNCHNLISGGYLYPTVGLKQPNESSDLIVEDDFVRRAAYYAHLIMSPLMTNDYEYIGETIIDGCQVWVYKTPSNEYEIVIINDSGNSKNINFSQVDQSLLGNISGLGFKKLCQLSADNLYDAAGINHYNLSNENVLSELTFINGKTSINPQSVNLPDYSISTILIGTGNQSTQPSISSLTSNVVNCSITLEWTIENDEAEYIYVVEEGNTPFDTILSMGTNSSNQYQTTFNPQENGTYNFQVKIYNGTQLIDSTGELPVAIDCIYVPQYDISDLSLSIENCLINLSWSTENDENNYEYVIEQDNNPIETLASLGTNENNDYQYEVIPNKNGLVSFQVKVYENNQLITSTSLQSISISCIPIPVISFIQVTEGANCQINFTWQVENNIPNSYFLVAISNTNNSFIDTVQGSPASLYSYVYVPDENDTYTFQVAIYDNGEFIDISDQASINISCIYTPPFVIGKNIIDNGDCSYTFNWTVANEQLNSRYVLSADLNGNGYQPISTQFSIMNSPVFGYNYTFVPEEDGNYNFKLEQFTNYVLTSTEFFNPLEITCAPDPDPILTSFNVGEDENCAFIIGWNVTGELLTSTYNVYTRRNGGSLELIYSTNSSQTGSSVDYQFIYSPEFNGSYTFEIEQLNNDVFVANANQSIEVNCIVIPDPSILDISVSENGNCSYHINWNVADELSTSSYTLFVTLDGDSLESIHYIIGQGNLPLASYDFDYSPQINGNYEIVIQHFNDGVYLNSVSSDNLLVNCIVPPPAIETFQVIDNEDCSYTLEWSVSNEILESSYEIKMNYENLLFEIVDYQNSSSSSGNINYSYTYFPLENGNHQFQVDRLENNIFTEQTSIISRGVSCIPKPSLFQSFNIVDNGNCTFDINWIISNEVLGHSYSIEFSLNGITVDAFIVDATEEGGLVNYTYQYTSIESASYMVHIDQLLDGEITESTSSLTLVTECLAQPLPEINSFSALSNNECRVRLEWEIDNQNDGTELKIRERAPQSGFTNIAVLSGNEISQNYYETTVPAGGTYNYKLALFQDNELVVESFTETVNVSCPAQVDIEIDVSPFFTFGPFDVSLNSNQPLNGSIQIVNLLFGNVVFNEDVSLNTGSNNFYYNMSNITFFSGIYIVTFTWGSGSESSTFFYF